MSHQTALVLAVAIPFAGAILIMLSGLRPNVRETITLLTGIALFLVVVSLVPDVAAGARPSVTLVTLFMGVPLSLSIEPLGMLFSLIASGLWIVTSIYAIGYMRAEKEHDQTRFYACFAIAISSTMGLAFSDNLLTLFIFYEVLTLSTYPLVTHHGDADARRGGRIYLGILISTSIGLLLPAILVTLSVTGTLNFTPGGILAGKASTPLSAVLLFAYVYGVGKAALMPIHRWLPSAMVAPTPVSALLHAVAVVKAGVFTILKIAVYIFGLDLLQSLDATVCIQYIAAATILIASLVAMTKDNLKARLAYSTVSQLSYIVLGAMLARDPAIIGAGMHIAMHAFGKITLFFCAGAILVASHKTEVSQMRGLGWRMPFTFTAFLIGSLSVIGLPPFGGAWSKWYIALGAVDDHQLVFVAVLMISSLLSIGYLVPVFARAFFGPRSEEEAQMADSHGAGDGHGHGHNPASGSGSRIREAPLMCLVPIWITALGCVALFVFANRIHDLLAPIVK